MPRCASGSHKGPACTCTTPPPTRPGSIRSSAGSVSLPSKPSAAAASAASKISSPESTTSSSTTTAVAVLLHGPPPPTLSSKNWLDYVRLFPGQHTSSLSQRERFYGCGGGGLRNFTGEGG